VLSPSGKDSLAQPIRLLFPAAGITAKIMGESKCELK
jgi:hypothetical protein